jgi:hypothetical protein
LAGNQNKPCVLTNAKETQMEVVLRGEEMHTASKTSTATLAGPIDMLIMPPRTSFGKYLNTVNVMDLL